MFEISIQKSFSAAHKLIGYQGDCSRKHGHNYIIKVFVKGPELNDIGILVDFKEIKKHLQEIIESYDHYDLNDIKPFDKINPTAENISKIVYDKLKTLVNDDFVQVSKVEVWETPECCCTYLEE